MKYKNEQTILKIIKYAPAIFIIIMAILITSLLYIENKVVFENEKIKLEKDFIQSNKNRIKSEIEKIHNYIDKEHSSTEIRLKESLKKRVYEAHMIATEIYEQNKEKGEKEVTKLIKDALRTIRFNDGRGYFFIYSFDYECILLPIKRELEGSNFYNFQDGKGVYLTRNIIQQVKKEGEGFLTWWYSKPQDLNNSYKKIGFNKAFEPYGWFIGTGEYVDEFEQSLQKSVLASIDRLTTWKNDYFFIFDYTGNFILYPVKELEGKNIFTSNISKTLQKDIEKESLFNQFVILAQNKGGFLTYQHHKNRQEYIEKTSYMLGFEPWNWIIGKGFYEDDLQATLSEMQREVEERFEEHLIKIFLFTAVLTLCLLIISNYMSAMLKNKFTNYKESIKKHIEQNAIQQSILAQQSKMASMGEMIGNIAHQWRQPLSAITSSATGLSLKHEMDNLNKKEFEVFIDVITTSAQFLSQTIDDFRNFFIPQKEKRTFLIEEAFEKTFKLINAQFKNRGIEFVKNIESIELTALDNELIQVLINLLNNAKDQLVLLQGKKYIFIDVYKKDNHVIIEIKDNGEGINEEIITKVFNPYFTTKQAKHGTGIGLYMSKEIIQKHMNGSIHASNVHFEYEHQNFKGALITIELPINCIK